MRDVEMFAVLLTEAANRLDLREPTQTSKEVLGELLASLKAMRECYQTLHWQARGEPFFGDHLMFERIYTNLLPEIDSLAEKIVGFTDDALVLEVTSQTARVSTHVQEIMSNLQNMTPLQSMFEAEKLLVSKFLPQLLNSMEQAGELSDGMENFLQSIGDNHENNIYLVSRRLKTQKELDEVEPVEPNISPLPYEEGEDEFDQMEKEAEQEEEK